MTAPAFQLYAQDFLTGCIFLTNEEVGIYIRILTKQWTDGKIPKKRLGFLVGFEWDTFSEELKEKFIDEGGFIYNKRLENEREKHTNFHKKQVENGKKGGRPRKNIPLENVDNIADLEGDKKPTKTQTETQIKAQKSSSIYEDEDEIEIEEEIEKEKKGGMGEKKTEEQNQEETPKPKKEMVLIIPEDFEELWDEWKEYRKAKKKKPYAGIKWEQNALNRFLELSNDDPALGRKVLDQTTSQNWEGLFKLRENEQPNDHNTDHNIRRLRNDTSKVSGTSEIISGARYTEFT
ncbi:DUF1376 domain-containing protein [Chryseobacterium potabilaquae]|uniref:DUF1376 domain-containing protein n=1 Tax=Chryseobacterium potabilaquae TaxID=2675057 RepID=A0A6N4X4J6_9FLAO|nr:DUF1376 domain-containing protein [Chryseobacterium potabilaquae]CAA7195429.1 hypothetical protein CHRY9293_01628 [Chryseobacterium potabilaquae]